MKLRTKRERQVWREAYKTGQAQGMANAAVDVREAREAARLELNSEVKRAQALREGAYTEALRQMSSGLESMARMVMALEKRL